MSVTAGTKALSSGGAASSGVDLTPAPGGRLTLTSGLAVTTADVTGAATIYYTPYLHDQICLYTGGAWTNYIFSELSLSVGTLSSATKPYDLYVYDNAGTLTLTKTIAWTAATTGRVAQASQDSRLVLSSDHSQLYVGTVYPSATTTLEDSLANRFVWNAYNRVRRAMSVHLTTNYTYTINTFRQANAATTSAHQVVRGLDIDPQSAHVQAFPTTTNAGGASLPVGVGVDSTTVTSAQTFGCFNFANAAGTSGASIANYVGFPGLGYHSINWLEKSTAAAVTTWNTDATVAQAGMNGIVMA